LTVSYEHSLLDLVAITEIALVPFGVDGQTIYTRYGDWFGWLMVLSLVVLVFICYNVFKTETR